MDGIQFSSYSSRGLTPFKMELFYSGKDIRIGRFRDTCQRIVVVVVGFFLLCFDFLIN